MKKNWDDDGDTITSGAERWMDGSANTIGGTWVGRGNKIQDKRENFFQFVG